MWESGDFQTGDYSYLIVRQKAKDSPATSMILAKISVERGEYHARPVIIVRQQWDRDSVVHRAYTVFDAGTFATLCEELCFEAFSSGHSGFGAEELRGGAGGISGVL